MEVYKTYKAAVISNGSVDGVTTDGNQFFTGSSLSTHKPCNPVDHLESVADFRARGLQLREGDAWVDFTGLVRYVNNPKAMNNPHSSDSDLFILQSATDQVETPEEKEAFDAIDTTPQQVESLGKAEWENGDECVWGGKKAVFVGFLPSSLSMCVIELSYPSTSLSGVVLVDDIDDLTKPETPEQREERERLEAAYTLYLTGMGTVGNKPVDFDVFKDDYSEFYLSIVDKTGYRKQ